MTTGPTLNGPSICKVLTRQTQREVEEWWPEDRGGRRDELQMGTKALKRVLEMFSTSIVRIS